MGEENGHELESNLESNRCVGMKRKVEDVGSRDLLPCEVVFRVQFFVFCKITPEKSSNASV